MAFTGAMCFINVFILLCISLSTQCTLHSWMSRYGFAEFVPASFRTTLLVHNEQKVSTSLNSMWPLAGYNTAALASFYRSDHVRDEPSDRDVDTAVSVTVMLSLCHPKPLARRTHRFETSLNASVVGAQMGPSRC